MITINVFAACNPSGSITVDNPNQSLFVNALAVLTNGDLECTVLPTFNRQTFVIVGCPIVSILGQICYFYALPFRQVSRKMLKNEGSVER